MLNEFEQEEDVLPYYFTVILSNSLNPIHTVVNLVERSTMIDATSMTTAFLSELSFIQTSSSDWMMGHHRWRTCPRAPWRVATTTSSQAIMPFLMFLVSVPLSISDFGSLDEVTLNHERESENMWTVKCELWRSTLTPGQYTTEVFGPPLKYLYPMRTWPIFALCNLSVG